ncbi:hypothetical protein [Methylobacterium sp. Leaf113]|uniref:hypothetical protein n=1 Tax=Methylobacterium sp. Leaf113 TaxID=1736259 RepID=UPI000B047368|nr:hypothetical protein [Methylobacterium sp. Leaf113]
MSDQKGDDKQVSFYSKHEKKIPIVLSFLSLVVACLSFSVAYSNYSLSKEGLSFTYAVRPADVTEVTDQGLRVSRPFIVSNTSNVSITLTNFWCSNLQVTTQPRSFTHRPCKITSGLSETPFLLKAGESQLFNAEIEIVAAPEAQKILRTYVRKEGSTGREFWDALWALSKAKIDLYGKPIEDADGNSVGIGLTAGDDPSVFDLWKGTYQGYMFYAETGRKNRVASPHFGIYTHGGGF